ncbi:MAG: FIST C-terminal domain-containing protein [Pelosinus sp.]|nr:FIST C-terminal domain-containing protein [Pelosinus sp.]
MAGKIKDLIDQIIAKRSNGNAAIARITKTKLVLKGINPDSYTKDSVDDQEIIAGIVQIAAELGVTLHKNLAFGTKDVVAAYSLQKEVTAAVSEISGQLMDVQPKMIIYFASSLYQPQAMAAAMQAAFPEAAIFGCTTAGEIVSGRMLDGSVVAMAFSSAIIEDVVVETVPNIKASSDSALVFSSFESYYQAPLQELDPEKHVGIVLFDGLSMAEERLMEKIGDCTNITFIGGSAGDDLKFAATYVCANGKAYTDAAVLALIKPACRFDIIKTQSFRSMGIKLTATKVDEASRTVFEFNGKSAVVAYAEAIGQSIGALSEYFINHPLGLMAGGEPFVRSPQRIKDDSIVFYCNMREGMELEVLEATQIVEETRRVVENKEAEIGSLRALINFNCILRTIQLKSQGMTAAYGSTFAKVPTIGFSTYGEAYIGHVNQTATILVFA